MAGSMFGLMQQKLGSPQDEEDFIKVNSIDNLSENLGAHNGNGTEKSEEGGFGSLLKTQSEDINKQYDEEY